MGVEGLAQYMQTKSERYAGPGFICSCGAVSASRREICPVCESSHIEEYDLSKNPILRAAVLRTLSVKSSAPEELLEAAR